MEPTTKGRLWTGRALSGIAILFLGFDAVGKFVRPAAVIEGTVKLGYPETSIVTMGVLLAIGVVLYAIPRTSVLGAIYLTGYLGGAVATNFRVSAPLVGYVLFPVYVAVFVWGGLVLRYPAVRATVLEGRTSQG
jgi:DoxX-like family